MLTDDVFSPFQGFVDDAFGPDGAARRSEDEQGGVVVGVVDVGRFAVEIVVVGDIGGAVFVVAAAAVGRVADKFERCMIVAVAIVVVFHN